MEEMRAELCRVYKRRHPENRRARLPSRHNPGVGIMAKPMNANVGNTRAFAGTVEALPDIV